MKMRTLYAVAAMAFAAAPLAGAQETKTQIVELGGQSADSLLLRYRFEAMWAIDAQRILLRDTQRDHYLLTLTEPCEKLDMHRNVTFVPALKDRIRSSVRYEVRDPAAEPCDIGRVEQIDKTRASALRAELAARN
jgi:hypothetical protein